MAGGVDNNQLWAEEGRLIGGASYGVGDGDGNGNDDNNEDNDENDDDGSGGDRARHATSNSSNNKIRRGQVSYVDKYCKFHVDTKTYLFARK